MKTRFVTVIGVAIGAAQLALCPGADAQTASCAARSSSEGKRVEEAGFVALGGLEQWVTIRGDDRTNPVLLHVHGGPGIAFSAFAAEFAPYEADFTVVQWDQRGAGCTFGRNGQDTPDVTLDRITRDGIELAEYLEQRLPDPSIVVLGHSFGSVVAAQMVARAPKHFAAYVGTGQSASFVRTADAQIAAVDAAFMQRLQSRATEVMTPQELVNWQAGRGVSMARLVPQVAAVDLFATIGRLEVPFVVIQGRHDSFTPTDLAVAFFEHVEAPHKQLVVVEGAGHFPHLTHTQEFLAALSRTLQLR